MKIHQTDELKLTLSDLVGEGFTVTQASDAFYYGAIAMFVTSLGKCTFAVLQVYAARLDLDPNEIEINLEWVQTSSPNRIESISMNVSWPSLPDSRIKPVARATHKCTVHNTIKECVAIDVTVNNQ